MKDDPVTDSFLFLLACLAVQFLFLSAFIGG